MAYYINPVDRRELPAGKDWLFLERPNGDTYFLVARDVENLELPIVALEHIIACVCSSTGLPLSTVA